MELAANVAKLRNVTWGDSQLLYDWRMNDQSRHMFRDTRIVPMEDHQNFLRRHLDSESKDKWFVLEIGGCPVGAIALVDFSPDAAECELSRLVIAPEHRGKGYGKRAIQMASDYAASRGVRRFHAEVDAQNDRSLGAFLHLGFREQRRRADQSRTFCWLTKELS